MYIHIFIEISILCVEFLFCFVLSPLALMRYTRLHRYIIACVTWGSVEFLISHEALAFLVETEKRCLEYARRAASATSRARARAPQAHRQSETYLPARANAFVLIVNILLSHSNRSCLYILLMCKSITYACCWTLIIARSRNAMELLFTIYKTTLPCALYELYMFGQHLTPCEYSSWPHF